VTLRVNLPPEGGNLTVAPRSGVALVTTFRLYCLGWVDEDLPLSYRFAAADTHLAGPGRKSEVAVSRWATPGAQLLCATQSHLVGITTGYQR
jgi:hypothetical protein